MGTVNQEPSLYHPFPISCSLSIYASSSLSTPPFSYFFSCDKTRLRYSFSHLHLRCCSMVSQSEILPLWLDFQDLYYFRVFEVIAKRIRSQGGSRQSVELAQSRSQWFYSHLAVSGTYSTPAPFLDCVDTVVVWHSEESSNIHKKLISKLWSS